MSTIVRAGIGALVLSLVTFGGLARTQGNSVPGSALSETQQLPQARQFAPPECLALMDPVALNSMTIDLDFDGSGGSELLLGTDGPDTITGRGGDDCIVGGAGGDDLNGQGGNDVVLGGNGADTVDGADTVAATPAVTFGAQGAAGFFASTTAISW